MVIPIGFPPDKFSIGRSGVEDENDFELDGMGIQVKVARASEGEG
jgi:hypothetical protein